MIQLAPITLGQRKARKRGIPRERISFVLGPDGVDGCQDVVDEGGVGWAGRGTLEEVTLLGDAMFKRGFSCWEGDGGCSGGNREEEGRDGEEGGVEHCCSYSGSLVGALCYLGLELVKVI